MWYYSVDNFQYIFSTWYGRSWGSPPGDRKGWPAGGVSCSSAPFTGTTSGRWSAVKDWKRNENKSILRFIDWRQEGLTGRRSFLLLAVAVYRYDKRSLVGGERPNRNSTPFALPQKYAFARGHEKWSKPVKPLNRFNEAVTPVYWSR